MSAPGKFRFISSDRRVREDRRFVVGKGNFAADIVPQGVKHVALVTCPHPAAKIVSIDKSAALAMPGVHYVLDGAELAGATNVLATGLDTPNVPRRPLAVDVARYAGEWVVAVVADSRALAEDAAGIYKRGTYGNTMTGNPRALDVACAVLAQITPELRQNKINDPNLQRQAIGAALKAFEREIAPRFRARAA